MGSRPRIGMGRAMSIALLPFCHSEGCICPRNLSGVGWAGYKKERFLGEGGPRNDRKTIKPIKTCGPTLRMVMREAVYLAGGLRGGRQSLWNQSLPDTRILCLSEGRRGKIIGRSSLPFSLARGPDFRTVSLCRRKPFRCRYRWRGAERHRHDDSPAAFSCLQFQSGIPILRFCREVRWPPPLRLALGGD